MSEALLARGPVEQARQGIVVGQVLDLDLGRLLRRDVLQGANGREGLAIRVEGDRGPGVDPLDLAVDDDAVSDVVGGPLEGGLPGVLEGGKVLRVDEAKMGIRRHRGAGFHAADAIDLG